MIKIISMKKSFKNILALLLLTLSCVTAYSQGAYYYIHWGYCDTQIKGSFGYSTQGKCAIYIPEEVSKLYEGQTLEAVRIGLNGVVSDLTVFITKDLNGTPEMTKDVGQAASGWTSVNFDEAYIPDGEGFYIGYSFSGSSYAIGQSTIYSPNGCWADLGNGWTNYAKEDKGNESSLCIFARFVGKDLPKDMRMLDLDDKVVLADEPFTITGRVSSLNVSSIKNYKLGYSIDGGEENIVEFKTFFGANAEKDFEIKVNDCPALGNHKIKCWIESMNNEQDAYQGNDTLTADLRVTGYIPTKRIVFEKGTYATCQYCPRGIVAFREMEKKYPDTFIGIDVHAPYDAMYTSSYSELLGYFSGYPSCIASRNPALVFSPTTETMESIYKQLQTTMPVAGVEATAEIDESNSNTVKVDVTTTFVTTSDNMNYRLAFVLMEDSVKGYYQSNYYSGCGYDMGGFENLPYSAQINMDHVARQIYGYDGISGSVPTSVVEAQPNLYQTSFTLPSSIQSRNYLKMAVLLIDGRTGYIENGALTKVKTGTSGITDAQLTGDVRVRIQNGTAVAEGFSGELKVYTLGGALVPNGNLNHGTYIVKGSQGSQSFVQKVAW